MGKLKDFLGVMAESNKKLQQEAMNSKNLDIEALTGDESEYIEMVCKPFLAIFRLNYRHTW
ncbi:hypothetical protein Hanom_Chr11g01043271 [Helianthus anomalus]